MKRSPRPAAALFGAGLLTLALALSAGTSSGPAAAVTGQRYVCPPCANSCDTLSFAAPGTCPGCGMQLVETGSAAAPSPSPADTRRVAFLIFDGVEVIDFTGPYEMFGAAGCEVYTVAATRAPVTTAMGLTVVPRYTFADAPAPDVLVVPGGGISGALASEPTLRYVREVTARDRQTLSVCNGAFILAAAGLLDGLSATTTNGNIPKLAAQYPKIRVVRDRRWVDNGHIVTAGGLSAGIDGALHVIENLFGPGVAQQVALVEEYDWQPSSTFARAALADREIPPIDMDALGDFTLARTEGDTARWKIEVHGHPKAARTAFMQRLEETLTRSHWTKATANPAASADAPARTSRWQFTGSDGKPWTATLTVSGSDAEGAEVTAELKVSRGSTD